METINTNAFATAKYDLSRRIVFYEFVGLIRVPLGLETLRKVMEFSNHTPVRGIVSDLSKLQGTFTGATEFFEKEYYPHMIKNGLLCTGIVVPNDIFTKYAANELKKKVGNFQLHVYENYKQAEQWVAETTTASLSANT